MSKVLIENESCQNICRNSNANKSRLFWPNHHWHRGCYDKTHPSQRLTKMTKQEPNSFWMDQLRFAKFEKSDWMPFSKKKQKAGLRDGAHLQWCGAAQMAKLPVAFWTNSPINQLLCWLLTRHGTTICQHMHHQSSSCSWTLQCNWYLGLKCRTQKNPWYHKKGVFFFFRPGLKF